MNLAVLFQAGDHEYPVFVWQCLKGMEYYINWVFYIIKRILYNKKVKKRKYKNRNKSIKIICTYMQKYSILTKSSNSPA